jgi:hypothetical protein
VGRHSVFFSPENQVRGKLAAGANIHQEADPVGAYKDEGIRLNRRQALRVFGVGVTAGGGIFALAGCRKAPRQAAAPNPAAAGGLCQFKVPVDEAARQMQRMVQYKEKSDQPGKVCSNCSQFIPAKYGDGGGCKLFDGGVSPGGVCLSYAPVGAPGKAG